MITIHGVPLSPFVRKVLLTLEYKGLDYSLVPVFPGSDDEAFRKISPLGKIPILDHDGFITPDSSIICRYLDQQFPDKPIYPADPQLQARACWFEELGDSKLVEACATIFRNRLLNPKFMNLPCDEDAVQDAIDNALPPLLTYLESVVPETGVLVGDHISIADIGIVTCFVQAQYGEYEVDAGDYPKLRGYLDRCFDSDILKTRLEAEKQVLEQMLA